MSPNIKPPIRIVLTDDQEFIRKAVGSYIPLIGEEFQVVAEVGSGQALFEVLKDQQVDLILLDLEMKGMNGFQVIKKLRKDRAYGHIKVIVFSVHYNEFFFKELVLLGASSYLPKDCSVKEFVNAVRSVVKTGFYILPEVTREAVTELIKESKIHLLLEKNNLSPREIDVLRHFSDGMLYKEIATALQIKEDTVKFHIKSIYRKTATSSHAELIKYAIRTGITDVSQPFVKNR